MICNMHTAQIPKYPIWYRLKLNLLQRTGQQWLWLLNYVVIVLRSSITDPDPHHFRKLDPDPDRHQSGKLDPNRHQSEKEEALKGHFGALEGPNLEKVSGRIQIRVRIKLKAGSGSRSN
jgi:hypothetical protein